MTTATEYHKFVLNNSLEIDDIIQCFTFIETNHFYYQVVGLNANLDFICVEIDLKPSKIVEASTPELEYYLIDRTNLVLASSTIHVSNNSVFKVLDRNETTVVVSHSFEVL